MVDYIRDEEEQVERIKAWWQENGTAAVITVVLAVAALIGWRQWQGHQGEQAAEASTEYQVMLEALSANPMDKAAINDKIAVLYGQAGLGKTRIIRISTAAEILNQQVCLVIDHRLVHGIGRQGFQHDLVFGGRRLRYGGEFAPASGG